MKTRMIGAVAMLVMASAAQASVRSPTDGARAAQASLPVAEALQRSQTGHMADEQFRKIAVRKADPYLDGAARPVDPATDGALRQVGPFTDGALARIVGVDPFTDGA
ncbi:hypothetical membrane protein (plasmid) [Cupriavidus necator N-1]|uniref:Hypothetical membrane protein n=1 Tax=Cupriavidus necator (strain ATCC 43291 / DSM 13513 / CCUG 52238 / LMG 8453 / N-1) TaxID=1042878 RepID=F8GYC0_CUPNN|nr:hypothetical protein [Cupriavidus necator]AEI82861.1 hypothetical membrane protein [Cupriavidus necator N-1]MDX6008658.1 hypothetical protein [Cupriavidus necator]